MTKFTCPGRAGPGRFLGMTVDVASFPCNYVKVVFVLRYCVFVYSTYDAKTTG